MSKEHKAWLVDLDGTLYKAKGVKLAMGLEVLALGLPKLKLLKTFRHAHEKLREELAADPTLQFRPSPFEEQVARTARALNRDEDVVRQTVLHWMVARPGKWIKKFKRKTLLTRIEEYRAQGGKTALVSDYPASSKLNALGAAFLFDVVISSGETEGLYRLKPSPDGFLLAAEQLGVAPSDCLVLGDRQDADGQAAKNAHMDFELIK